MPSLHKLFALAFFTVTLGLPGCVTGNSASGDGLGGSGVTVVERSKEQQPTWMEFDAGTIHDAEGSMKLVETQTRILSLPLGVKQTQLAAVESHRRATATRLKAALNERATTEGVDVAAAQPELERHVDAVIDGKHGEVTRVSDIYFEKLVNERAAAGQNDAEFYQVHVLVQMPRGEYDAMIQQLARRLSQSTNPNLRRLGQAMLRNPSLSH